MYYLDKQTYIIKLKCGPLHKDVGPYKLKTIQKEENYLKSKRRINQDNALIDSLLASLQQLRIGGVK